MILPTRRLGSLASAEVCGAWARVRFVRPQGTAAVSPAKPAGSMNFLALKRCRYPLPVKINNRCALRHSVVRVASPLCAGRRHDDAHLSHCCRNGSWFGRGVGRSGAVRGLKSAAMRYRRACMWSRAMWRGRPGRWTISGPGSAGE